ncbi:hypothetical protein [Zoogloea sp.]|uniref:hypothetical protein n=1 Tax=Zoogloea sp. TaxID=49181 RepID=UPI0035AE19FF
MIVYLTTSDHGYTIGDYLAGPGTTLAGRVVHRTYPDVLTGSPAALAGLVPATWIFADVERLLPAAATAAARLWRRLADAGCRLLNHPTRSLRRYELLRVLCERGRNDFDVYRVTDRRLPRRWPVFLRRDDNHTGAISPLLHSRAELRQEIDDVRRRNWPYQSTIAVEFSDTADGDGLYRKYGAFRIGEAIVPGHMDTSRHWVVKDADLDLPEERRRELAFLDANPWTAEIRAVFELARLEYGRLDFSLRDGRMVVWEINTNPLIASPASLRPDRAPVARRLFPRFAAALAALDLGP